MRENVLDCLGCFHYGSTCRVMYQFYLTVKILLACTLDMIPEQFFPQKESDIFKHATKDNCALRVFPLNGVQHVSSCQTSSPL